MKSNSNFIFIKKCIKIELGTCIKNLIFIKVVEGCQKNYSAKGYIEIQMQSPVFGNKNSIRKILRLKIQTVETCCSASSTFKN